MTKRMVTLSVLVLTACAGPPSPAPTPVRAPVRFQVLGNASPSDSGPPTLRIEGRQVTIRGLGIQVEGGGLYGDVDLSEPPPRPVYRQVIYEAMIGPLAPGSYDVWVGRFDAEARMVEVAHEPLRIEVEAASER